MSSSEHSRCRWLYDIIVRIWSLLLLWVCTILPRTILRTRDNPLGSKQLLQLAILLLGKQRQDLGDVSSLACHGVDGLAKDWKLILLNQGSLDHISNNGQFKLYITNMHLEFVMNNTYLILVLITRRIFRVLITLIHLLFIAHLTVSHFAATLSVYALRLIFTSFGFSNVLINNLWLFLFVIWAWIVHIWIIVWPIPTLFFILMNLLIGFLQCFFAFLLLDLV